MKGENERRPEAPPRFDTMLYCFRHKVALWAQADEYRWLVGKVNASEFRGHGAQSLICGTVKREWIERSKFWRVEVHLYAAYEREDPPLELGDYSVLDGFELVDS